MKYKIIFHLFHLQHHYFKFLWPLPQVQYLRCLNRHFRSICGNYLKSMSILWPLTAYKTSNHKKCEILTIRYTSAYLIAFFELILKKICIIIIYCGSLKNMYEV